MLKGFLAVVLAAVLAANAFAADASGANKVYAYYFHGTMRCPTCHKLEQYSKEAIESGFKPELASGKLEFKAINVDEKGNEHYIQDYQLYTKSLVISLVKDGREAKSKNLAKIWEYVGNKQAFSDYVTREIRSFLQEAR